jgi:hypothetical protein
MTRRLVLTAEDQAAAADPVVRVEYDRLADMIAGLARRTRAVRHPRVLVR